MRCLQAVSHSDALGRITGHGAQNAEDPSCFAMLDTPACLGLPIRDRLSEATAWAERQLEYADVV